MLLRPIYTIRFVVYDSGPGVCDRINTRTNVRFQISPSTNEQKMSYRVDWPLIVSENQRSQSSTAFFTNKATLL